MTFDEKLSMLAEEIEIPSELEPENIAKLLKTAGADNSGRNIEMTAGGAADTKIKKTQAASVKNKRKHIAMRSVAVAAACLALVTGVWLYRDGTDEESIDFGEPISYADVKQPESYGDLYGYIRDIYLNGGEDPSAAFVGSAPTDKTAGRFTELPDGVSSSDIIKTDGSNIYYLSGGVLNVIKTADGSMEAFQKIENEGKTPVDMFISAGRLVLISESRIKVSDSSADDVPCIVADIYSIGEDGASPISTVTQPGSYTSARMVDGSLYMVTAYKKYQHKPLESEEDLDNFVPVYYVNGEKRHVSAEDIVIPSNAGNTDYTLISGINCADSPEEVSVSAVLGTGDYVYCSADRLYVAGTGFKDTAYTVVTSFALENGTAVYRASGAVEGTVISPTSMGSRNGSFMLAASTRDSKTGEVSTAVYILNDNMIVSGSAGKLLPDTTVSDVRFAEGCAALYSADSDEPLMVIDLTNEAAPVQTDKVPADTSKIEFGSGRLLSAEKAVNDDGSESLKLTVFNAADLSPVHEISTEGFADCNSEAFTNPNAILTDSENGLVGVPYYCHDEFGTRVLYTVWSYDDSIGFTQIGQLEYADLDDSLVFRRGVIIGNTFYAIGDGRVVSAEASTFKVIDTLLF